MNIKNFCAIHHLYYNGTKCPMCESERIERAAKAYVHTDEKKPRVKSENKEPSEEMLKKLVEKFTSPL